MICLGIARDLGPLHLTRLLLQQLLAWKSFFDNSPKYDKIGRVVLPPLDPNDPVPPPCEDAMPQAGSS